MQRFGGGSRQAWSPKDCFTPSQTVKGKGLDLALLADRVDDRMGWRTDVEGDNVFERLGELQVRRQLERADAMRRELVSLDVGPFAGALPPLSTVASPGGDPRVRLTTPCTVPLGSGCLPGLRVLSRVKPSTPSAAMIASRGGDPRAWRQRQFLLS